MVMEPDEMTDDIVRDLHEVMVSLCARVVWKAIRQQSRQEICATASRP